MNYYCMESDEEHGYTISYLKKIDRDSLLAGCKLVLNNSKLLLLKDKD